MVEAFNPNDSNDPMTQCRLCAGQLLLMADADGATSIRDLERLERALGPKDGKGRRQGPSETENQKTNSMNPRDTVAANQLLFLNHQWSLNDRWMIVEWCWLDH